MADADEIKKAFEQLFDALGVCFSVGMSAKPREDSVAVIHGLENRRFAVRWEIDLRLAVRSLDCSVVGIAAENQGEVVPLFHFVSPEGSSGWTANANRIGEIDN